MNEDKKDVGEIHDAIFYIQAALSAEHHAIESFCETNEDLFLKINEKIRRNRSKKMYNYISRRKGQVYCLSKHLLQMAQSLKELGNRHTEKEEYTMASECFKESQDCEALFILLNNSDEEKKEIKENKGTEFGFINKLMGIKSVESV